MRMRLLVAFSLWGMCGVLLCGGGRLHAQKTGPAIPQSFPDTQPVRAEPDAVLNPRAPHDPLNPLGDAELDARLSRIRADEARKRIVDDAKRLVALTTRYRAALVQHGTPTQEDQDLLAQIEKLAREVKGRMSGQ